MTFSLQERLASSLEDTWGDGMAWIKQGFREQIYQKPRAHNNLNLK